MRIPGLNQPLTYWAPTGVGGFGEPVFAAPSFLMGYWADKSEVVRKDTGEEFQSKAVVSLASPVLKNGYLARGTHANASPYEVEDAERIEVSASIPDLRNLTQLYVAYL